MRTLSFLLLLMIIASIVDDMMTNYLLVEMDQTGRAGMFLIWSIPIEKELRQLFNELCKASEDI